MKVYKILYLPTAEIVRLFSHYSPAWYDNYIGQTDIYNSYDEAYNIILDNRIIYLSGERKEVATAYIDHKGYPDYPTLVPKYLLEVVEVDEDV